MKKILISAFVLVLGVSAVSAQSPWFLGGQLGVGFGKNEFKVKETGFRINPMVGYMFNDNWGMTLDLGYSYNKTTTPEEGADDRESKMQFIGAGLGVQYFCNIAGDFYYAPNARVGYQRETESKYNKMSADINFLAFEFRPSDHWGFNINLGGIGYEYSKFKDLDDAGNAFGLTVGNAAQIGFKYYF